MDLRPNGGDDWRAACGRSDRNLAEVMRAMARCGYGSAIYEHGGLVCLLGSHANPGPYRNAALQLGGHSTAEEVLDEAISFFSGRKRSFVLWVPAHADDPDLDRLARDRGFSLMEAAGLPQLARMGPPEPVSPRDGVALRWAETDETRQDFLRVNADAWGLEGAPLEVAARILFEPDMLDDPSMTAVVAYLGDRPASTCMVINYPLDVIGGYWGATAPFAVGNRLLDLTTRSVYCEGFARWPYADIAVCQNSPGSASTLARMGFQQISSYKRYLVSI